MSILDHAAIAARIPHAGSMCLLAQALRWDETSIVCAATSHRDPGNPLRADDRLAAVIGVEYAAQAMALHGALLSAGKSAAAARPGMIGAVRGLVLHVDRLDDIDDDLLIHAEREAGDDAHVLYRFRIDAAPMGGSGTARLLVEGRASVLLGAAPPPAVAAARLGHRDSG